MGMRFDILTVFPEMFTSYLERGVVGRALERGRMTVALSNIRDFADDPHRTTDDRPYGGGFGMVMKPEPIQRALAALAPGPENRRVILLSPQGRRFEQQKAWELARYEHLVLICGRYEGVDERVRVLYVDEELSIGDYVLSGGELAALVILDAVSRLLPGVLGGEKSNQEDTFEDGLLEYPHYTRPALFMDLAVPQVLLSGDHARIRAWRREESLKRTLDRRPDLLDRAALTPEDRAILARLQQETPGTDG